MHYTGGSDGWLIITEAPAGTTATVTQNGVLKTPSTVAIVLIIGLLLLAIAVVAVSIKRK